MKKILIILVCQFGILTINSQEIIEHRFILNGIIGVTNIVPIQDAVIEINDEVKFTNKLGEFSVKSDLKEIRIKINHLGFSTIDTIFNANNLNGLTELNIIANCLVNRELALSDIRENKLRLLLIGGVAPTIVIGQELIENKYNFNYYDFGCNAITEECVKEYNFEIFKYLDHNYGNVWRNSIRKDVIGLNDYKKY